MFSGFPAAMVSRSSDQLAAARYIRPPAHFQQTRRAVPRYLAESRDAPAPSPAAAAATRRDMSRPLSHFPLRAASQGPSGSPPTLNPREISGPPIHLSKSVLVALAVPPAAPRSRNGRAQQQPSFYRASAES